MVPNDRNVTISIANTEFAFVPYNKVIWYLMCYIQSKECTAGRCYPYVTLIHCIHEAQGIYMYISG
jgi:hypothetical protein